MGGRNLKSQDYYIERCKATHGDKYDYSKFNYESFCKDVIIICLPGLAGNGFEPLTSEL